MRRRAERRAARALAAALAAAAAAALAQPTPQGIAGTKHDLSTSGPGPVRAESETRVCVFCHTPHNATPLSPLWNRADPGTSYDVYASETLHAAPSPTPTGATKLCLSCHDGTIALGAVVNPPGEIALVGGGAFPDGSLSSFGTDLSGHHPVSFSYSSSLPHDELEPSPPAELTFGNADELHCSTCHDPHEDRYGRFLVKDPVGSALCTTCHRMDGWEGSAHDVSSASVAGVLPRPPKTWPNWTTLGEWGCEACHTPHFAPTAEHLLSFTDLPPDPYSCTTGGCHGSEPGPPHATAAAPAAELLARGTAATGADIAAQLVKPSAHRERIGPRAALRSGAPGAPPAPGAGVACADCHDAHEMTRREATPPELPGLLQGVPGVDRHGAARERARFGYEVCFGCHGDGAIDAETVPRVVATVNARLEFAPENPSYHPVVEAGRELDVPSLPSSLEPTMAAADRIACTDCHADDSGGARGPHGSRFAPILARRYETADGTPESFESYALCYQCHERESVLADESFLRKAAAATGSGGGHSGHLAAGATCAACHDAHGVAAQPGDGTGSHTHLVNFDLRVALPLPGAAAPLFRDTGARSGTCALICHGVVHEELAYP